MEPFVNDIVAGLERAGFDRKKPIGTRCTVGYALEVQQDGKLKDFSFLEYEDIKTSELLLQQKWLVTVPIYDDYEEAIAYVVTKLSEGESADFKFECKDAVFSLNGVDLCVLKGDGAKTLFHNMLKKLIS